MAQKNEYPMYYVHHRDMSQSGAVDLFGPMTKQQARENLEIAGRPISSYVTLGNYRGAKEVNPFD